AIPTAVRRSRRPMPGRPAGNDVNSARSSTLLRIRLGLRNRPHRKPIQHGCIPNPQEEESFRTAIALLRSPEKATRSKANDPATHGERDGLGTVARAELLHDMPHVNLDRLLR